MSSALGRQVEASTLQTQVGEFEDMFTPMPGPPRANWHGNDTLFIIFFGINDMVSLPLYRFWRG